MCPFADRTRQAERVSRGNRRCFGGAGHPRPGSTDLLWSRASPLWAARARTLLVWLAVAFLLTQGSGWGLARYAHVPDPAGLIPGTILYATLLAWVAWQLRRCRMTWRQLFGRPPDSRLIGPALWGVPLWGVALGSLWGGSDGWLAFDPQTIPPGLRAGGAGWPWGYAALEDLFAMAMAIAPLVEELVFRGVLLPHWSVKWGVMPAVLASSLFFAACHDHPTSSFIAGATFALL